MTLSLADNRPPIPPADLILRVAPPFEAGDIEAARAAFDIEGLSHLRLYEQALAAVGGSFEQSERLLEFGCGCGRFLRHLGPLADRLEIHGTDIDAEMIEWLRANVQYGRYEVAPHEPPLPYPDHHFDLVINCSVFTHLDERLQDLWLAELQRVTRPGALLLLTVEGQSTWNRTCEASERIGEDPEPWRVELESRGIVFIADDLFLGSTHPDFYHSTVHAPWYVFEHWTRFFDIAAYVPDGAISQDLIVFRRRPDGVPQPRPIGRRMSPRAAAAHAAGAAPTSRRRALFGRLMASASRRLRSLRKQRTATGGSGDHSLDARSVTREISMLRVGLYEQGRRLSILAAQLRDEIEAVRNQSDENG
jgi:SAM-dependent methyltransferase